MEIGSKLTLEYRTGDAGMEPEAGDGVTLIAHEDGGVQFAIYWSEDDGTRHTVHLAEQKPKLLYAIARAISTIAERANLRLEGAVEIRFRPVPEAPDTETKH